ncbi:hypothetical protein HanOQP8_Chr09g0347611 [Helianthus annuus]|nr:hypothetical protein HanLR1_Chr09g0343531 [Helianthus annuus]KAJ0713604.1 hypothetical protein HanOQP8_Chr09g0347611 [Helianthus annuus]
MTQEARRLEDDGKFIHSSRQLNDQLQIKANELEKLFAQHKLRLPNPTRQTNVAADDPVLDTISDSLMADNQNHHNSLLHQSFADESRGKSYDRYMKKRDARLTELWDSNGQQKEAKMKALHDILERHSTEMKARPADKHNSAASSARRRLRSFTSPLAALKREEPLDFGPLQDDADLSGFDVSRNIQGKTPLPHTPTAVIPRSATKLTSTSSRRRQQPENSPLAQSVPNFSDLRKENTKPYSTATKAATRSQLRNYTRSTSTNEETPPVKEDKSRRSQSLRKSSVTSLESSEGVVLTQSKNMEPKRSLRKNTAKLKASVASASEAMNKAEKDEPPSVVKEDFTEEFDKTGTEDPVVDGSELRMSHESEKLMDSESEHGNTFSQGDHTWVADLPEESPMSWKSLTEYSFSYTHEEASDVESPITSPASWNLHPTEARTRKKWGITQKPNLVPSSDMTKGFKRLLKFGKKSRNTTENLADYISATTSEGDDDTEDGRDPNNRSSEDLRKSRMGYYSHESSEGGKSITIFIFNICYQSRHVVKENIAYMLFNQVYIYYKERKKLTFFNCSEFDPNTSTKLPFKGRSFVWN